jgi:hypothetical protein
MRFLIFLVGLSLSLILSGCGDAKQKAESQARFQSFTNNLQKADVQYGVSFVYTTILLQQAVQAAQLPIVQETRRRDPSYDAAGDYLQHYAEFDISITNGQNAIDLITKAETDFQYIYTTYKGLPPSFKDDFYNMKDLMDKNMVFIQTLKQGELQKDGLQNWMDNSKKLNNSYHSMLLEIDRIKK